MTSKVSKDLFGSTKQIEKIEVDMAQLELSSDSDSNNCNSDSDKKNSTLSRLQQESESFLASLHSTPDNHNLASSVKTVVAPSSKKDSSS